MLFLKLKRILCSFARTKKIATNFEIYTDGSLKQGRGSWAYLHVENGQIVKQDSGPAKKATCTQMEFRAAIEALQALPIGTSATLYSDSRILIDTMTLWVSEWKKNGWVKKTGQDIPSLEQIQILDALNQQHSITWRWIKAHSGIFFNERCDDLCIKARTKK